MWRTLALERGPRPEVDRKTARRSRLHRLRDVPAPVGGRLGPEQTATVTVGESCFVALAGQIERRDSLDVEGDHHLAQRRGIEVVPIRQPGAECNPFADAVRQSAGQLGQLVFDAHCSCSITRFSRSSPRWMSALTVPSGRPVASEISPIPSPTTWRNTTALRWLIGRADSRSSHAAGVGWLRVLGCRLLVHLHERGAPRSASKMISPQVEGDGPQPWRQPELLESAPVEPT